MRCRGASFEFRTCWIDASLARIPGFSVVGVLDFLAELVVLGEEGLGLGGERGGNGQGGQQSDNFFHDELLFLEELQQIVASIPDLGLCVKNQMKA